MSEDHTYNGWSTYETWAMALWIDNEEWSYTSARVLRDNARIGADDHLARVRLADELKNWQERKMPNLPASVFSDLLGAAFGEIDWFEIAEHYLDEVAEEVETS